VTLNRRETLKISAGALLAPALMPSLAKGQSARTKIVLLGTTGGPVLQVMRAQPSNAVVVGGACMSLIAVMALPDRSCKPVLGSAH
jgi:hypothetical protein